MLKIDARGKRGRNEKKDSAEAAFYDNELYDFLARGHLADCGSLESRDRREREVRRTTLEGHRENSRDARRRINRDRRRKFPRRASKMRYIG